MGAMSFPPSPSDGDPYEKWYYDAASGEWKLSPISSSTLWSAGDDNKIYYDLGEVGVGTSEPTRDLVIFNSAGPVVQITDQGAGNVNSDGLQLKQLSANSEIMNKEAGDLVLGTNDTAQLTINSIGNATFEQNLTTKGVLFVDLASGDPSFRLRTNGVERVRNYWHTANSQNRIVLYDTAGTNGQNAFLATYDGGVDLRHAGTQKFVTQSGGAKVTGSLTTTVGFALGNWKIELDGNALVFKYNNNKVVKINTAGKIISADDVRAFGTP